MTKLLKYINLFRVVLINVSKLIGLILCVYYIVHTREYTITLNHLPFFF